jgi:hypothetical protein
VQKWPPSITKPTINPASTRWINANFVGIANWFCVQPCAITAALVVMSGKMTFPKVIQPAEVTITKNSHWQFSCAFLAANKNGIFVK